MRGTAHLRIARAARLRVDGGGYGITHVSTWALHGQIRLVPDGANVASIRVFHKVSTALHKVWITLEPGDGAGRAVAVIRSPVTLRPCSARSVYDRLLQSSGLLPSASAGSWQCMLRV